MTPDNMSEQAPLDFVFKTVDDCSIHLDVYPPSLPKDAVSPSVPAVVFFHGGGLSVGNRRSWFPRWLKGTISTHMIFSRLLTRYRTRDSGRDSIYLGRLQTHASSYRA